MFREYKNPLENKVYEIIKPYLTELPLQFHVNEPFFMYKKMVGHLIKKGVLRLLKNVPKTYGFHTHTEMVLLGLNIFWRIDCKFQANKYSYITIDNIKGEIERNTIENKLYEDMIIFVVDGEGINWKHLKTYRKTLPTYVKILSFEEFRKHLKKQLS